MSATMTLKRQKGMSAKQSAFNSQGYVAFTTVDDANVVSANYPIARPTFAATSFSYEVRLFLEVTKAPVTSITNVRFWSNVAKPGVNTYFYVGTAVASAAPVITRSVKATHLSTAYYDAGTSILWSDKTLTGVGDTSHTLVMQLWITSSSPVGDITNEACIEHWSYDEA